MRATMPASFGYDKCVTVGLAELVPRGFHATHSGHLYAVEK
jgi:hypothetical protein